MRALAAGIILSLALVHILPESVIEMSELTAYMPESHPYNPAGAIAVAGVLFMVASDALAHAFLERKLRRRWAGVELSKRTAGAAKTGQPVAEGLSDVAPAEAAAQNDPHTHVCMGSSAHHHLAVVAGGVGGGSVRAQV
jgi:hypothetical protein